MPRVCVLLPVRNARRTLAECLQSLATQNLEDHEVVAVDDGSTDGSDEILDDAARRDPRIRVVHTPPRGLPAALNRALAEARADLVARMDADDVANPDRLARQARRMTEDPAIAILGSRVRLLDAPGHANAGMREYVAWLNGLLDHEAMVRELFVESPLAHPSVMMRRRSILDLGGYRDFDGPEDYDLWLRAWAAGLRFAKVPETLLLWRDTRDRLTRTDPRYSFDRFLELKLRALEWGLLSPGRPVVVWGAGPIGKGWARALRRRGHDVVAFVDVDPRKIGCQIHGARVVGIEQSAAFPGALHLAAVGQPGARERIRQEAGRQGLMDGRDLIAVA